MPAVLALSRLPFTHYAAPVVTSGDLELTEQRGWMIVLGFVALAVVTGYAVLCTLQGGSFYFHYMPWQGFTVACTFK
jgi:hypothetical protein